MSRAIHRSQAIYNADPTVHAVVEELTGSLRLAGITDPRRIATDVVAALLEVPRSWPVMNRETSMDRALASAASEAARKLSDGAPFAYAVGYAAFRHLNLLVDERVLIPRPETEVLVGEILEIMDAKCGAHGEWGTAIDIGTGSGAIALSLASEGRFDKVIATDASIDALDVARSNAERSATAIRTPVEFRRGVFLSPVRGEKVSVLVSNPPYISFSEIDALPRSVRDWEPPMALFSGHDGMAATREIVRDGSSVLSSGGTLALEVDERRASLAAEMIMRQGSYTDVGVRLDLTGRERFVFATRI
ncbi:MAG: peptide chain release factor N(5)-glutamine methyltransferase [Gemmatimonadales bacterium]